MIGHVSSPDPSWVQQVTQAVPGEVERQDEEEDGQSREETQPRRIPDVAAGRRQFDNADLIDGAMIFGTGFAPFRGGPLNYARTRGAGDVVAALRSLSQSHGERFAPDPGWDTFA